MASNASSSGTKPPPLGADGKCVLCELRHKKGFPWMFSCCLEGRKKSLIDTMNVAGNFFVDLEEKKIFSKRLIAEIKGVQRNEYEQKEVLLTKLCFCDDYKFDLFLEVLRDNDEPTIATTLSDHFSADKLVGTKLEEVSYDKDLLVQKMKKTTVDFYNKHSKNAYPMTSIPRGRALIINIFKTNNEEDRHGSQYDVVLLDKLFKKLSFAVEKYQDINSEDILRQIENTLSNMKEEDQCFVLFIMSHGGKNLSDQEVLYGTDRVAIVKSKILDIVSDDTKYPLLQNKPRLVFFDCCRGGKEQRLSQVQRNQHQARRCLLYCHASSEDFVSYREPLLGSRFVRAFGDTLVAHAHDTDILGLMEKTQEATEKQDAHRDLQQIPKYYYDDEMAGERKLFFFPGITKEVLQQSTSSQRN